MKFRLSPYICMYLLVVYKGSVEAKRKVILNGRRFDAGDAIRWDYEIQTRYNRYKYLHNQTKEAETPIPGLINKAADFPFGLGTILPSLGDNIRVAVGCFTCNSVVQGLMLQISLGAGVDLLLLEFQTICMLLSSFITYEACSGIVGKIIPTAHYVIKHRPRLTAQDFCGYVLQELGCTTDSNYFEWTVDERLRKRISKARKSKPRARTALKRKTHQIRQNLRQSRKFAKIIVLADLHVDPLYTVGAEANCDTVDCCRPDSKARPGEDSIKAGVFGDNHSCDVSYRFLELVLQHIKNVHKDVELIYMTGDLVPHNGYRATRADNTAVIRGASRIIENYFPTAMVIPALGNHEPDPVNQFSPENAPAELNTRWLYDVAYDAWNPQWIPDDQRSTFLKAGFYMREMSSKLKIIVLNTNICYGFNFWGMYNVRDNGGQLEWLVKELKKSKSMDQKVHIIGHTPPGNADCHKTWSRNYYHIIYRYRKTVTGQFYAHLHSDEFKIFYHPRKLGVPINNMWLSPSLTPYEINNPGYKVFYADRYTYEVMDFETWIIDLEKSNMNPEQTPSWFSLYRATVDFGIPDTTPKNMAKFVDQMAEDKTVFDLYYQYSIKALTRQREDTTVYQQKQILCNIVRPYFREEEECNRIQTAVDGLVVNIPVVKTGC